MKKEEIRLIDKLYKDLYLDSDVLKLSLDKYDKFNNIEKYINYLEETHSKAINHNHIELLKELYYAKYVIKREDISESYYNHQQQIALERGYGHIELTLENKKELQEEVINNQKRSLDTWLDYLLSEDAKYPFWAKYWAFQGMLKIGSYNKEKGTFNKRTIDTIDPFIDLNREALALSIDLVIKGLNKENIDDKELEGLVKSGSFAKIYTYILNNILKDNKNIAKRNIGKWVKYDMGSDHMPLVNSLKGYNTGWCTAGEATAKTQLSTGDFYVYYTLDEEDNYKVPRIAIRMDYYNIAEIRGIANDQNIEPEMEKVVEEKLKEFPDKEKYYKKVNDMKTLTSIYNKHKNKIELSKEELRFLYEIDSKILGFGYSKDPRIDEIISERSNLKQDLATSLECDISKIALSKEELTDDTIYYKGDIVSVTIESNFKNKFPKVVKGRMLLDCPSHLDYLELPMSVDGELFLKGLKSVDNIIFPNYVGGTLSLELEDCKGVKLPKEIGDSLYLNYITSAEGVILPGRIGGALSLNSLTSAKGLVLPNCIEGGVHLDSLKTAEGLSFPEIVGYSITLDGLMDAKDLILPKSIGGNFALDRLEDKEGLVLPKSVGGFVYLGSLISAEGLSLPETVGDCLYFDNLQTLDGLMIPDPLNYKIIINDEIKITNENAHEYRAKNKTH